MAYRLGTKSPGYTLQAQDLKELRDDPQVAPWLAKIPSQILQQAVRDTDMAYRRFFAGKFRYPTWVKKGGCLSFRDPHGSDGQFRRISDKWGGAKIQGVGWVRVLTHRPLVGSRITSATVVIEPDSKMFISILCERHKRQPSKPLSRKDTVVGIDRGVTVAIATSDGELMTRENWTIKEKERLRRLERERERKSKARKSENLRSQTKEEPTKHKSGKQKQTELKIATMHGRARRRRDDFVEQSSCTLGKLHCLGVFEDLHLPAMTHSAKGTIEEPGRRVKQKAGLNRAMLDKSHGAILARTKEKALRRGHQVLLVPAPYTSTTCSECGYNDPSNRASRSVFICGACGYKAHAGINAAINICERGMTKLALAGKTPVAACQGTNLEPGKPGAEPEQQRRRGSGNQDMGYITDGKVA